MSLILTRVYFIPKFVPFLMTAMLNVFFRQDMVYRRKIFENCLSDRVSVALLNVEGFCVLTASFSAVLQLGWGLVRLWLRQDVKSANPMSALPVFCM